MAKLVYIINTSLDGYIKDATGAFDWTNPEQIFEFITDLIRPMATYLYGRKMYETMTYWDTPIDEFPPERRDFAHVWQNAQKVVFSRTIANLAARNARLERSFDAQSVAKLKRESKHDIAIAGAELAGLAFEAGLIDECHLFVNPVVVGGGQPAFRAGLRLNLDLVETRRFDTGVVHLHYRVSHPD